MIITTSIYETHGISLTFTRVRAQTDRQATRQEDNQTMSELCFNYDRNRDHIVTEISCVYL